MTKSSQNLARLTAQQILILTLVFAIWRIILFAVGAVADYFFVYAPTFPYYEAFLPASGLPRWIYSWANFDGVHYITIAQMGYGRLGFVQAFFPVYPFLILRMLFLASEAVGIKMNTVVVGLLVSNIAAIAAVITWFGFLHQELGKAKAWLGVAFLLSFPTALFFGAMYTESLFFAAVIGSFWAARNKKWGVAALCAVLATGTRVVGAFLIPALMIELWLQWRESSLSKEQTKPLLAQLRAIPQQLPDFVKDSWKTLVLLSLGSLGMLGYMAYLQYAQNDPLYFLHVQSEFGAGRQESLVIYPQVVWRSIKILLTQRPFDWRYYTSVLEFLAGTTGFLGLLAGYKKIRLSYLFFGLGVFLLPTTTGTFSSMPRYILICFPLFLMLIELTAKRKWLTYLLLTVFWISLCLNVMVFVQGYWLS